jgi:hypothetical protein
MSNDDDLRVCFDALRRIDGSMAPGVDALIGRVRARRQSRLVLAPVAAAAAALIVVAGLRYRAAPAPVDLTVAPSELTLLSWRSPTASLLQTPGKELLQTVPTLTSSILPSGFPLTSYPVK